MKKLKEILTEGKAVYPKNHKAAMKVTKGGSCCANCKFWDNEHTHCDNDYYRRYAGKKEIDAPKDEFCSDWWQPLEK